MTDDTIVWPDAEAHMRHDRSLDELARDYLRYLDIGKGNAGWESHNRIMLRHNCEGVAALKGWEYVKSFPWWEDVKAAIRVEEPKWPQE
jgi:hypothetical protein